MCGPSWHALLMLVEPDATQLHRSTRVSSPTKGGATCDQPWHHRRTLYPQQWLVTTKSGYYVNMMAANSANCGNFSEITVLNWKLS